MSSYRGQNRGMGPEALSCNRSARRGSGQTQAVENPQVEPAADGDADPVQEK